MSKAVLISIKPRWCELIADGKKVVEVRKTRPKIDTPFKCYIYETRGKTDTPWMDEDGHLIFRGRGEVIGEFVCERIEDYSKWEHDIPSLYRHINLFACIDYPELYDYLPNGGGYGWHISDLKIYDKPKELSEFQRACTHNEDCGSCKRWDTKKYDCISGITRPPQSWCYVEEIL